MTNKVGFLLAALFLLLSISCNNMQRDSYKAYSLALKGNNLYITMPRPTESNVGINEVDWKGVSLSEVVEDIYQMLRNCNLYGQSSLYVRFETVLTDRYGNQKEKIDECFLMDLPILEVKKYQASKYLNDYYHISDKIYEQALPKQNKSNERPIAEKADSIRSLIENRRNPEYKPVRIVPKGEGYTRERKDSLLRALGYD